VAGTALVSAPGWNSIVACAPIRCATIRDLLGIFRVDFATRIASLNIESNQSSSRALRSRYAQSIESGP
jgi:hypothetical protein